MSFWFGGKEEVWGWGWGWGEFIIGLVIISKI